MSVRKLGTWVPGDYDADAEPLLTEFRYYLDAPEDVEATFNVFPSTWGDGALIAWDLEDVGLVTWHRADSVEEADEWVYAQIEPWRTINL